MSVLKVKCPETGREISTGIEIDPESSRPFPISSQFLTALYAASITLG